MAARVGAGNTRTGMNLLGGQPGLIASTADSKHARAAFCWAVTRCQLEIIAQNQSCTLTFVGSQRRIDLFQLVHGLAVVDGIGKAGCVVIFCSAFACDFTSADGLIDIFEQVSIRITDGDGICRFSLRCLRVRVMVPSPSMRPAI